MLRGLHILPEPIELLLLPLDGLAISISLQQEFAFLPDKLGVFLRQLLLVLLLL